MPTEKPVRLAIVGTGIKANHHAQYFSEIPGVEVVAGVEVNRERLDAFVEKWGVGRGFTSLEEALDWGEFDAIANVTPDRMHHPTTMQAIAAGKHVFCEKPLATDHAKALEMTEAIEAAGLVNMVNLTYRDVAALAKARALVKDGAIGAVRHIEASYLQSWLTAKTWGDWRTESGLLWRLSRAHGSNGTLGDIGIHILDFASHGCALEITDMACRLKTFDKAPEGRIEDYVLDANDSFAMVVEFENGALGTIHASRYATGHLNDLKLRIYGTKGGIDVEHAGGRSTIRVCLREDIESQTWREIDAGAVETNYQRFIRAVRDGRSLDPDFAHAANLQRLIDLGLGEDGAMRLTRVAL